MAAPSTSCLHSLRDHWLVGFQACRGLRQKPPKCWWPPPNLAMGSLRSTNSTKVRTSKLEWCPLQILIPHIENARSIVRPSNSFVTSRFFGTWGAETRFTNLQIRAMPLLMISKCRKLKPAVRTPVPREKLTDWRRSLVESASVYCAALFAVPSQKARPDDRHKAGSGLFLRHPHGNCLVTAHHLWTSWKAFKQEEPKAVFAAQTRSGARPLTLGSLRLVQGDQRLDLAVIQVQGDREHEIERDGKRFFEPRSWPLHTPQVADEVIVYGFPAAQRVVGDGCLTFHGVGFAVAISSISERHFVLAADRERMVNTYVGDLPPLKALGGLSGAPVFTFSGGELSPVGIVYEAQNGKDATIMCSRLDFITPDGPLDENRLLVL
jgi:hypothetical protein